MKKPVVLIIRDGWGVNPNKDIEKQGDAVQMAQIPFHREVLWPKYPQSYVKASGEEVGLPDGQMGNSEVGHLNLGAGRVVYQSLTLINKHIRENTLKDNEVLQKAMNTAKSRGSRLHLISLVSDGGVHAHQDHLVALCKQAREANIAAENIWVHGISDGRDTLPTNGQQYFSKLEVDLAGLDMQLATLVGRYYAMDRDTRWERTQLAWESIVDGVGEPAQSSASEILKECYAKGMTDEFIESHIFRGHNEQRVKDGDVVIFVNFRSDRARQLSQVFLQADFDGFERKVQPKVDYVTMTQYDATFDCDVIFSPQELKGCLGDVVSKSGLNQLRIAETEKYPHVTYFFNGGDETPCAGEDRHIIPSPKVATYDLQPEMNAEQVTQYVLDNVENYDLVIINYANPDMVGHTGDVKAVIKAVETIDNAVQRIVERVLELDGQLIITADHGNCEKMREPDGSPNTAHTTFLVHAIYVANDIKGVTMSDGILADISPTLIDMLGVDKSPEMTGNSLLQRN